MSRGRSSEVASVYAAAAVQGVALVTFPAAGAIFTSSRYYGLSSSAYGAIFLPQALMAIAAALLSGKLARWLGIKQIFLAGLVANAVSMALLFLSQYLMGHLEAAYAVLLAATTVLGIGFGLTTSVLNTFAAAFFPRRVDSAVLILNALLGVGTALAPIFIALFVGLGIWWGLPVLVGVLLIGFLLFSLGLPLQIPSTDGDKAESGGASVPHRFWLYAAFALLYGVAETVNGNWATLYMTRDLGSSVTAASMALMAFWALVTFGRLLFAAIHQWFSESNCYRFLPLVIACAFIATALLPKNNSAFGILAFALAGLGCSALLPLTISFGQEELTAISASVAGYLIAFYQMGYGIAAFGVGPLLGAAGLSLSSIYGGTALIALVLAALSFGVVRHQPARV
ncbi:MAG: MFS transporter [Chthoniobacteraceae bacterium]